jgi:hypothetical protein
MFTSTFLFLSHLVQEANTFTQNGVNVNIEKTHDLSDLTIYFSHVPIILSLTRG